jgi:hypothetical protein
MEKQRLEVLEQAKLRISCSKQYKLEMLIWITKYDVM